MAVGIGPVNEPVIGDGTLAAPALGAQPLTDRAPSSFALALRAVVEPALVAAILGAVYLLMSPPSTDHAAQVFRVGLFEDEGLGTWNNLWFGGHHLPGYSLLFPPLAALVGIRLLGVLSAIVASAVFGAIAQRRWGEQARLAALWFAAGSTVSLFTGRLTFMLGVTIAMLAVLAAQRGYRVIGVLLAVVCPLASPVAGLFLVCAGAAYSVAERRREGLELALAALASALLVTSAFPEGGSEPFWFSSFYRAIAAATIVFVVIPREQKLWRWGIAAYAAMLVCAWAVPNPMGGNAVRMGSLLLGPAAVCALWPRHRMRILLVAPLLLHWQWSPVVRDLAKVLDEPTAQAAYYEPLRDYLLTATKHSGARVEVLPVESHWESAYVAEGIYMARGWERQLDRKLNPLFYEDGLRAAEYRRWLDQLAVGFIAVPRGPLDYSAYREVRLIRSGLPYLSLAFRNRHWRVYRVRNAAPMVSGAAHRLDLSAEGFTLRARRPGTSLVRVRYTPYWAIAEGSGCVEEGPGGFTAVQLSQAGAAEVTASFSPWRIIDHGPRCTSD